MPMIPVAIVKRQTEIVPVMGQLPTASIPA
jgi:hypothetical protein